jgi:hypothetical protein
MCNPSLYNTSLILYRSIVGTSLGGTLAEPVKSYPAFFRADGLFGRYPYLLPNLVCTGVIVLSFVIGLLFLEETHKENCDRCDSERGRGMIDAWRRLKKAKRYQKEADYHPITSSPISLPTSTVLAREENYDDSQAITRYYGFTRNIKLIILSYGILAL